MSDVAIIVFVFVVLMVMGVPIYAVVGFTVAAALYLADIPQTMLAQTAFTALQPFPLLSIPLFVLAGRLMEKGGMANHLIRIATSLVGAYKGSLGLVTVIACAFFAALNGSGPATTAAVGSVTIPTMVKEGYSRRYAGAVAASAGALGSLIPPSNLMIIYALVAEVSIPRMFFAGIIPGIVVTALLLATAWLIAVHEGYGGRGERFAFGPLLRAMWEGKWALGAPIVILGGIYAGVFTPTEAAGVAVAYALFVGLFVYKELSAASIMEALRFTALIAGLLVLITPTTAFGQVLALYDLPERTIELMGPIGQNKWLFLFVVGIFLILIGTFMESLAQIILFTPVLLPAAVAAGIDPITFGIFTVLTCEIGFLTPPVGGNLFIGARLAKATVEQISVAVIPYCIAYTLGMIFVVAAPQAVVWLPNLIFGPGK
ncbi:MAG: TRAP transporter large permease [Alphaproteobacteria bacterium]|nr:TRAP transporter large permease [Alphaproteobacteria bacterium]